jgi:hypothetical protein
VAFAGAASGREFTSCILVWTFFPVYDMVLLSFTLTNDLFQPGLYVEHPTLKSYVYTMGQDNRERA